MYPRSKYWHILAYVVTRQSDIQDIRITKYLRSTHCLSDHCLISSKAQFKLSLKRQLICTKVPKKINVSPLLNPVKKSELQSKLDERLSMVQI